MSAYYNENESYAAAWLRNLIAAGHIAPGDVDERSIVDVRAADLAGYTQCHFFAGIGIWSAALRQAGWDDARPVWTGSCPCQSFSAAGKGLGTADERHLWPEWFRLIRDCRPLTIFGEQIASKDGLAWLDIVCTDLENAGYPVWPVDLCAAGVGAPHIRQRLWFVAYAMRGGAGSAAGGGVCTEAASVGIDGGSPRTGADTRIGSTSRELAHPHGRDASAEGLQRSGQHGQQPQDGGPVRLGDADGAGQPVGIRDSGNDEAQTGSPGGQAVVQAGAVNGFWSDAEWIACTDGKARPVEAGTFPLAHGDKGRVGKLRTYGNAINQEVAAEFIAAAQECLP